MSKLFVLTVIARDEPGIVKRLSAVIEEHGGNWSDSRMARLAGRFAGILRVEVPAAHADAMVRELEALQARGLRLVVEPSAEEADAAGEQRFLDLRVIGGDHPGIVHAIARTLAERGVNVEELATACANAPLSGDRLFEATARLRAPSAAPLGELQSVLEDLAQDLMVDIRVALPE